MARFTLSHQDDWELTHDWQDIRGWPVKDTTGASIGTVKALVADTESEIVESIVLDDDRKISAREVTLDDGVVYVPSVPIAVGVVFDDHRDSFLEHCRTTYGVDESGFTTYEPAYRFGFDSAEDDTLNGHSFSDVENNLRLRYDQTHGEGSYDSARDAIEYGYGIRKGKI